MRREMTDDGPDRRNIARGRWGEQLAARHYLAQGWAVLDRNWRSTNGEIDLIVERDGLIVFCEVKTRRSDRFGPPGAAVGPAKQARIRRVATDWLDANPIRRRDIRFDVVAITGVHLECIEAAF